MINIIVNSDPRYNIDKAAIRAAVISALQKYKVTTRVEVGVNIIGDRKMHELNRTFRGIDSTTDILTFALEDPQTPTLQHIPRVGFVAAPDKWLRLGDIVISYPQVVEDASLEGISVDEEIRVLVEHGVNHLLGVHHD
ncbi:rRNA maturation RNase YbeY [Candidatus Daviesbacteria bacterium]|nr:rRNA maturation RNase YbeY [Candidatus Daviesbacteria bacterium]